MNYRTARSYLISQLSAIYIEGECENMLGRFIETYTEHRILDFKLNHELLLNRAKIEEFAQELSSSKPVQYVLGYEWFGDLKLMVNEHVLIPRPETLELVMWVKEYLAQLPRDASTKILDIGTGSGCIPIWLKNHLPSAGVDAIDISVEALRVAKQNAKLHQAEIQFEQVDILEPDLDVRKRYDVIISNPPYISEEEKDAMASNVLDYEPHLALFVQNNDPLQFYKAIQHFSEKHLAPSGQMFFELGSEYAMEVVQYFASSEYQTELRKDMYDRYRMLRVWK